MNETVDTRPHTVVLLQYTGIGDLVWHIQYFKAVAQQSRGGKVSIVAQPSSLAQAFLASQPWVETVIDHDHRPRRGEKRKGRHAGLTGMWRMAQLLKSQHYDRIVLFSGRPSRGLIAALSGIPVRMGFGYNPLQRIFLNQGPYIPRHQGPSLAVYPEASAFAVAQGFCDAPIVPKFDPPPERIAEMRQRLATLPRPLYALAIGTSETHKQWGADRFARLATELIARGAGVVLLGGPAEQALAREIEAMVPEAARAGLHRLTDAHVLGSAAALHLADVCVGNDTGMVNVAAAVGCPTYVLIARPTLEHDPLLCNVRADKLSDITVEQVLERVSRPPARSKGEVRA